MFFKKLFSNDLFWPVVFLGSFFLVGVWAYVDGFFHLRIFQMVLGFFCMLPLIVFAVVNFFVVKGVDDDGE